MADDILKNIPLPADLPENWTSGQTIAPTGAEVGLDNQYGYNYLMMQVNNAQKALKALAAQREEDLARIKYWFSDDPTSPASFIGGTWERIKDSFLLAAGDTYAAGSMGGEAEHALTIPELARHAHYQRIGNTSGTSVENIRYIPYNEDSNVVTWIESSEYMETSEEGQSQPHNNMPPYVTLYVWKRIA